jgi:hypothetical protein
MACDSRLLLTLSAIDIVNSGFLVATIRPTIVKEGIIVVTILLDGGVKIKAIGVSTGVVFVKF